MALLGFSAMAWVTLFSVLLLVQMVYKYITGIRAVYGIPGLRPVFSPLSALGVLIGSNSWNLGLSFAWYHRKRLYKRFGSDTVSIVPIAVGTNIVVTSSLDVAKQVIAGGSRSVWHKADEYGEGLFIFGHNVASTDGEDWRRHRRITNPAFNPATYALVWRETIRTYHDMVESERWNLQEEIYVPSLQKYTFKFAFSIIATCGFGLPFPWSEPPTSDKGLTIAGCLRIIVDTIMVQVAAPKWIYKLPFKYLKDIVIAKETLMEFMREQVALRRNELVAKSGSEEERRDVFTRIIKASLEDTAEGLSDEEVIGNVFVMLFAGHETTATTLAVVMGFLSIHQDIQEEVYQQILEVCGDREPTFEDMPNLDKVLACFLEALRLFPAGPMMIRLSDEDSPLLISDHSGQKRTIIVKKRTPVLVDLIGLEYNEKLYPEPDKYIPSRWYSKPNSLSKPSEAFTAFSFGPRVCIGQNFSRTEGVAFLASLLKEWKLDIKLKPGETREMYQERVMDARVVMTLSAYDIPIVLKRRSVRKM